MNQYVRFIAQKHVLQESKNWTLLRLNLQVFSAWPGLVSYAIQELGTN